jgi:hypothetical protein
MRLIFKEHIQQSSHFPLGMVKEKIQKLNK